MIDIIQSQQKTENLGFKKVLQRKQFHILEGGSDEQNRKAVEDKQVDILLAPEQKREKRHMHQRDSGLNQVLCKLAQKNKVAIGFSFSELLNAKDKASNLGKMMQNVRLCRKYKVKMVVVSFAKNKWEMRHASDLGAFAQVIGMTPKEAKAALNFQKKQREIKVIKE